MKFLSTTLMAILLMAAAPKGIAAETKIGLVSFKTIVEESKVGKQEQSNFDNMKKQMEEVLEQKEKSLQEISAKINDADYMDSLSPEADAELKHKFRSLNQEMAQHQQQYYQILQQANMKIIQGISEEIHEAAKEVAKNKKLDLVINEETTFFYTDALDISKDIVAVLDKKFEQKK